MTGAGLGGLRQFVERELGIQMPKAKVPMLQSRLYPRLRALGLSSFDQYTDYLFGPGRDGEVAMLIDAVTTNKTDFWRESSHFEHLVGVALPTLGEPYEPGRWKVWCAGCSTGEEPYTLSMVLDEWTSAQRRASDFGVLATDVSSRVLAHARAGVYDADRVTPLPARLRERYVRKSRDPKRANVRIAPQLRERVAFHRLNFMDQDYGVRDVFDVVFFRNVAIYFDAPTRRAVVGRLCKVLRPGGYLFIGQSESLDARAHGLEHVGPATYRRL